MLRLFMPGSLQIVLIFICFLVTFVICGLITILPDFLPDIPNARSSHSRTVPRGGGVSFALASTLSLTILAWSADLLADRTVTAMLLGSVFISLLGLMDDAYALPALPRLTLQGIIALCVCLYGIPERVLLPGSIEITGWPAIFFQILWLMACVNFFNFMDGLDGLAGMQSLFTSLVLGTLFFFPDPPQGHTFHSPIFYRTLGIVFYCQAAGSAGFLLWNLPPARLFMGDTGSYFLGFLFGLSGLASPHSQDSGSHQPWLYQTGHASVMTVDLTVTILLLLPFFIDAQYTIILRLFGKKNIFQAHREHLYQMLFRSGWPAWKVDLLFLAANLTTLPFLFVYWNQRGSLFGSLWAAAGAAVISSIYFAYSTKARYKLLQPENRLK